MPSLSPHLAELLEPISSASPTGAELDINVPGYSELEAEVQKPAPNYAECIVWASKLLKSSSKHVRVAALLGFAWYRTEKLAGLQDAMLLLAGLVERYSDKLFPANAQQRSKHLQFINTDKVVKFLKSEAYSSAERESALAALQHLIDVCGKHFPQNGPVFTSLKQALENPTAPAANTSAAPGGQSATVSSAQPIAASVPPPAVAAQTSTTDDQQPQANGQQAAPGSALATPGPKLELPEAVTDLLEPISANAPAGRDVTKNNDEDYQEYLALQSESNQIKPNYDKVITLAENLLKDKCKDLEAMAWLAFAWFGKRKFAGLKDGTLLMLAALEQFREQLFPEEGLKRSRSVSFFNRKEVARILAKEKVTKENAKDILALKTAWGLLKEEYHQQLGAHFKQGQVSPFKAIAEALEEKAQEADDLIKPTPQASSPSKPATSSTTGAPTTPPPKPAPTSGALGAITSRDGAFSAMKKGLLFFFEEEKDGKKTRKVADDVAVYALSRELRWSKLVAPEYKEKDEGKITAIEGPTPEKQTAIKNWIANSEWDALIPDFEIRFINDEGFAYWLEGQRYVVQALEAKGGKWQHAAQEVKFHLARLIRRAPELTKLMFKDKKTPFAEKATLNWLENEVRGVLGSGAGEEKILPPIMGEEYEPINKEYEAACGELPENFQKNAEAMQQAAAGDVRRKGRFLRGLNLANYCLAAKKPELAKALLADLMKKIEAYQLAEWEPSLCVAVWQSAYLANLKLLQSDNHVATKADLHTQQSLLFDQIGKHDCVRALELASRQPAES